MYFLKSFKHYFYFSIKNIFISIISFAISNLLFFFLNKFQNDQTSAIISLSSIIIINFFLYVLFNVIEVSINNFFKLFLTSISFRAIELFIFLFLFEKYNSISSNLIFAFSIIIVYLFKNTFVYFLFKKK